MVGVCGAVAPLQHGVIDIYRAQVRPIDGVFSYGAEWWGGVVPMRRRESRVLGECGCC